MTLSVIMSTYNPDPNYLVSQIESIQEQSYAAHLFIRDDGSTVAESVSLLKELDTRSNITVVFGENLGFRASFLKALQMCPLSDYYSFCDQDDVWLKSKNECAVSILDENGARSSSNPYLCACHFSFCDENLNFVEGQQSNPYGQTFENALTEASVPGFVMTFNNSMRNYLLKLDPAKIPGHDWAAYSIATAFDCFIEDYSVSALYRRHSDNVSEGNEHGLKLLSFRVKTFLLNDGLSKLRLMYSDLLRVIGPDITSDRRRTLDQLNDYSLKGKIKKAFKMRMYRRTFFADLCVRIFFLIGRM